MILRRAFTLIELLIVVVIVSILVAIAIPRFASTKGSAYTSQLKSDLRNLAAAQESYYNQNGTYASTVSLLTPSFVPSARNTLTIVQATTYGWSATATSTNTTATCALFYGVAAVAPATTDGQLACQ
jgi:type IV pilus assembly protein PilA